MSIASRFLGRLYKLPPAETHAVVVGRDLKIPMGDGVNLLADHYYPRGGTQSPLVLVRSVYGRSGIYGLMYGRLLAERGYRVLVQSCRGTYGSEGSFTPFLNERSDGLDTLAWIRRQAWFKGKLATAGISYLGYVQWAIAAESGPQLQAICLIATASQFKDQTYPGDAFSLQDPLTWTYLINTQEKSPLKAMLMMLGGTGKMRKAFGLLPLGRIDRFLLGREVRFWQDWLNSSPPEYDWWKPADFSAAVKRVEAPVRMVTGWYDIFLPWQLADYLELKKGGHTPHLSIGPWSHTDRAMMAHGLRETVNWLDTQFKGQPHSSGPLPVHLYVMGLNRWRDFPEWPPNDYSNQAWYLQPERRLSPQKPPDCEPDRYTYDPSDPTPSLGGATMSEAGARNNRKLESRADVLTFSSDLLENDLEVIGPVTAEIYVRSSRPYADFHLRLCDVYPSGRSMNICDGIRRTGPGRPAAESDGITRLVVELWPTACLFKKGHRVRLQVSSGAFPHFARNTGSGEPLTTGTLLYTAEQTVYHDPQHPSCLNLPVKALST